ncbi:hypothetical protein E1B28_001623 [Marasmius oreades]|uniref:BHLH domain-containing protein n=1 Tax=Marasmius oreades TaxID=181124 RepID=A0A9P7V3Z0_9AGAR|nr:uncharacterized protein E1B28_001623 [Marasmius oreades]KAG7099812.1 hypothetical protein E1B28_001623 [Marasmius oreades]
MEIDNQQSHSQQSQLHSPAHSQEDHSQLPQGNYLYSSDQEQQFYNVGSPMQSYQVVPHDNPTRHLSEMQQQSGMHFQSMPNTVMYQSPVYSASPPHVSLPIPHSPPPPFPELYDPLSPPISGSDTSADGIYNSSGGNSPSSSRANSLVHRNARYNPTPSPTSSSGRRSRGRSHNDSDEDDMGANYAENLAHNRKEATRRQRIEAEQRRRDELRDGYARLKDALPVSNQKSSKVSLLERATNYIQQLETQNQELQNRLQYLEQEMQRLRALNEKISLPSRDSPSPGTFDADARPLSPPPETSIPNHSHANVSGRTRPVSEGSSPSNSENGY